MGMFSKLRSKTIGGKITNKAASASPIKTPVTKAVVKATAGPTRTTGTRPINVAPPTAGAGARTTGNAYGAVPGGRTRIR